MKGKKKIISLLTVLLLLALQIAPVFASSTPSDVKDTPYETAVATLSGLGIMEGYPDGTFQLEKTITRAEFSTLVARALGLENAAKGSVGNTIFKDVNSTHWASGYVNLAVSNGIVKGYTDKTFRPEAQVTYAEAITMIVRMLGYEHEITGTNWPSNYLAKAAEIGVTAGVNYEQSKPATRGNVALLLNNSLDIDLMKQTKYGTDMIWERVKGATLLTDYLYVHKLEEANVAQTPGYSQGTLDPDEVTISYDGKNYYLKAQSGSNYDSLLGHEVTVYVKDVDQDGILEDDEVVLSIYSTTSKKDIIAWDYITNITEDNDGGYNVKDGGIRISLDATDDTFDLAKDAVVYYNHEKITDLTNMATDKVGVGYLPLGEVAGTVIKDRDDNIIFMNMVNYDNPVVITKVDEENEKVTYFNHSENESTLRLDGETYEVYKNGKLATLDQLAKDDVLYFWELTDGSYVLEAYDGKITGTLEDVNADGNIYWDYVLTVDGKQIYVGPNFTYSTDQNETVNLFGEIGKPVDTTSLSDLEDMVGSQVTVYLGRYTEATDGWNYGRHIVTSVSTSSSDYQMVSDAPWKVLTSGNKYYIELTNKDDQAVVYEFTEDQTDFTWTENGKTRTETLDFDGATFDKKNDGSTTIQARNSDGEPITITISQGDLVDVEFNKDGTISALELLGTASQDVVGTDTVRPADINSDYDRVKINGVWYYVTPDTAFYDATPSRNEAVDWSAVTDVTFDLTNVIAKIDGSELEAMVFEHEEGYSVGQNDYGLVLKRTVKSDGLYVSMAVEKQVVEYYAGDLSSANRSALVEGSMWRIETSGNSLDSVAAVSPFAFTVTNPAKLSTAAFDGAKISAIDGEYNTVTSETYRVVRNGYDLYLDVDGVTGYTTGDLKVGSLDKATNTFTVEKAGYEVKFSWTKLEIVGGGVDSANGVVEVMAAGGNDDFDPTYYVNVDKYGGDSFYYDVDSSFLTGKKILKLDELTDGDIVNVYQTDPNSIFDYIVVIDR